MIKAAQIEYFQSWREALLKFCSGVNIIVGSSGKGKTGIFRAIYWAIFNRPQGFHFKSVFAKKENTTSSGIEFDDGGWIVRERGAGLNQYSTPTMDVLEAIRSEIPEEIQQITNLKDYNVQGQHDKYFLLQDTPGEVARQFNNVVGLDIIDFLSTEARLDKGATNKEIKNCKKEIKRLENELQEFKDIDDIEKLVVRIETNLKERDELNKELGVLQDLIITIQSLTNEIDVAKKWLCIEVEAEGIIKQADKLRDIVNEDRELSRLLEELQNIKSFIPLHESKIYIGEQARELKELNLERNALQSIIEEYYDIKEGIKDGTIVLNHLKIEQDEVLQSIDVCPVCFSKATDKIKEKIFKYYGIM